jgi:hypothetical protein
LFFCLKISLLYNHLLKLYTYSKRQSKFDRFFGRDEGRDEYHRGPNRKGSLIEKPSYQYGVVGQPSSILANSGVQNAFGNSSGTGQAQDSPQSQADQAVIGNGGGLGQANGQVGGPLGNVGGLGKASGPSGALGTDGGLGQTAAGTSHSVMGSTPSIPYTSDPSLIPLIARRVNTEAASGFLAAATSSRPSSSRFSDGSSSQALGPLVTSQGGYLSSLKSWNPSHGYGQAHSGPSTLRKNNGSKLSISSQASTSSVYSHQSWNGDSSTNNPITTDDNGSSVPPTLPSMEASSHQQQQYQQDHRRNSFVPIISRQVTNNAGYEYRRSSYAGVGSSSVGGGSSSQEVPLYDEQGRPKNMLPEKAPLVHLDGALYREPSRNDRRRSGYEPPAYIE